MIEFDNFIKESQSPEIDLVWISETHGIANNFKAYKLLISELINVGFKSIALEYPEEFENFTVRGYRNFSNYEDGRFSEESLQFFQWLRRLNLKMFCFDVRHLLKSQQEGEDLMAENLLSKLKQNEKTMVISGSFHGRRANVGDITPMAGIVEKAGYKILPVFLKYAGGHFYNFGLKEEDDQFLDFDEQNLPFGIMTINTNPLVDCDYWFHVGRAKPVKLLSKNN